jgi:hypothetical protein
MASVAANTTVSTTTLNSFIRSEISRILSLQDITQESLEGFAQFVIANHKKKEPRPAKPKPLKSAEIKAAVFDYFGVGGKRTVTALRKSSRFQMETEGMDLPSLASAEGWKALYREFVGYLPGEESQSGYGCINGVNIFQYFKPWRVFGLDPATATQEDKKNAYYGLSKIYHPDNKETGDSRIFDLIKNMYASISAEA